MALYQVSDRNHGLFIVEADTRLHAIKRVDAYLDDHNLVNLDGNSASSKLIPHTATIALNMVDHSVTVLQL